MISFDVIYNFMVLGFKSQKIDFSKFSVFLMRSDPQEI